MKVMTVASLVTPFMLRLETDKESGRLESVRTKSLAFKLTYVPAKDGNASSIDIVVPGVGCGRCGAKAVGKTYTVNGEKIAKGAKHVCEEIGGKVKQLAKKACGDGTDAGEGPCGCCAGVAKDEEPACAGDADADLFAAEAEAAEKAAEDAVLSELSAEETDAE